MPVASSGVLKQLLETMKVYEDFFNVFGMLFFAKASACRVWDLARKFGSSDSLTEWKQLF